MKEKQFALAFTDDGRLSSSTATVAGAGTAVLEAGTRVWTFVGASLLGAFAAPKPGAAVPAGARTFEQVLEVENAELLTRRTAYRETIAALQTALGERAKATASDPSATNLRSISVLEGALESRAGGGRGDPAARTRSRGVNRLPPQRNRCLKAGAAPTDACDRGQVHRRFDY